MGMSDSMEDMTDDEIREALALSRADLLARAAEGEPAQVAHSDPRRAVDAGPQAIKVGRDVRTIVIRQGHFEDQRSVKVARPSVTIR
jgi:hypothetical protein